MITQILKGKRIFITEDNTINRVIYTVALKLSGAIIDFDLWGDETLSKLQRFNPDLIVLDLMLPRGNSGFGISTQIRALPDYSTTPIVAISAADTSSAVSKCKEMGFSGFIAKPIEEDLLPAQLLQLIEGEEIWYTGRRSY